MTKRDLVIKVAKKTGIRQVAVMEVLQNSLDMITDELASGGGVEFRNFGVFEIMVRKPRVGRNPNEPDTPVEIPERVVVKFKPGKIMRERVIKINPDTVEKTEE